MTDGSNAPNQGLLLVEEITLDTMGPSFCVCIQLGGEVVELEPARPLSDHFFKVRKALLDVPRAYRRA